MGWIVGNGQQGPGLRRQARWSMSWANGGRRCMRRLKRSGGSSSVRSSMPSKVSTVKCAQLHNACAPNSCAPVCSTHSSTSPPLLAHITPSYFLVFLHPIILLVLFFVLHLSSFCSHLLLPFRIPKRILELHRLEAALPSQHQYVHFSFLCISALLVGYNY